MTAHPGRPCKFGPNGGTCRIVGCDETTPDARLAARPLETVRRLVCTAAIDETDGGRTVVIQTADQAVRVFITAVFDGHRPGRVAGGIVRILGPNGAREFGGLLAGDIASDLQVGDEVGGYIAGLATKHTGVEVAR